jgi:hypothetical protein
MLVLHARTISLLTNILYLLKDQCTSFNFIITKKQKDKKALVGHLKK